MKNPATTSVLPIAGLLLAALVASSCSADVNNNAPTGTTSAGASAAAGQRTVDDGGCTKNSERIAQLQAELDKNLYGIAAAESDKATNTNPNPVPPDKKIKIAFSIEGLSHPFLVKQKELAEAEAARLGVDIQVISANDDVNQQFNDLQNAITQGVDALMMMPAKTQGLDAVLGQASAQNIPYFFTQKGMLGVQPASQVLAPYANEGRQLGQWVAEHYKDEDNVNVLVITGITGDASSVARVNAFEIELLKACNFTILAEQPGQYRREESNKAAENMLAAHKDVDLVFGANDEAALGAIAAIEAAGRTGIDVVGLDGQKEMFTAIEQGKALATVIHKPTAGILVGEVVKYLRGEPVPQYKVLDEDLVTKERIETGSVEPAF
jgi:ABC-type sugar transport system, periplasmic component